MTQFLTPEEMNELTGACQSAKQKQVLDQNGIYYITRLDNTIVTTWHHVNHPFILETSKDNKPDFSSMMH